MYPGYFLLEPGTGSQRAQTHRVPHATGSKISGGAAAAVHRIQTVLAHKLPSGKQELQVRDSKELQNSWITELCQHNMCFRLLAKKMLVQGGVGIDTEV